MIVATRIPHLPRPSRVSAYFAGRLGPPVIDPDTVQEVLGRYDLRLAGPSRNLRLGRRSRNVAVTTQDGKKVVKLYRPQWSADTVRYGHSILERLAELRVPASALTRTPEGANWTETPMGFFAVFDFIPGTNYSLHFLMRDDRLRLTTTSGWTLARLHRSLRGFVPDGAHHLGFASYVGPRRRDVAWHRSKLEELRRDSEGLEGAELQVAQRLTARSQEVLEEIERLDAELSGAEFPRLIIHGDYGLHNLLFESPDRAIPIDYELSHLDWRLNDIISALVKYRYTGGNYDFESMSTFLRGYAGEFPLTEDEFRLLPAAWRFYKLQATVQYWNSYFETGGPIRKLASALDSLDQADWVLRHPAVIAELSEAAVDAHALSSGATGSTRTQTDGPKVMQVTPNLEIGGAQETVRTLAKYLPRQGFPTLVCTFDDGPLSADLEDLGVVLEHLPARRHSALALPRFLVEMAQRRRDLLRLIDKHGIDIVQTQGLGTLDFLVMTLRFSSPVQVWWTIQNANFMVREEHLTRFKWLLGPKRAAHRLLYRLGLRAVDGVIAVSDETKRSFSEVVGSGDDQVEIVCNAVDVELYPSPVDRDEMRARLGFTADDHLMTMVGTFKRQKGHAHLVEAAALLGDRAPHLHILMVGDGELLPQVRAHVEALGLADRIHLLGSRRDVPDILAASDSFVLPSLWEGLPVALVEAMASRLPVIATRVSGTSQVMLDGRTGWLVPPADPAALEHAIVQLLADPKRASDMAVAARERVESEFSANAQAEQLAELFRAGRASLAAT
jgi:glycosyltransferase involved in cell wall biosynthesis/Ser/Thr protein kinase RdoA (MazF antagonist)